MLEFGAGPVSDNVLNSWILSCGCCSFNGWLATSCVRFRHAGDLSASDAGQLDGEDGDSGDMGGANDDVNGGDVKGTEKDSCPRACANQAGGEPASSGESTMRGSGAGPCSSTLPARIRFGAVPTAPGEADRVRFFLGGTVV